MTINKLNLLRDSKPLVTRTRWAEEQLRWMIISGDLAPGERVHAEAIAAKLGISPTPVREACIHLAADGLLEIWPHRGARVAAVSMKDTLDTARLRVLLEPLAFRLTLSHRSEDWASNATLALQDLEAPWQRHDAQEYEIAHNEFHRALVVDCGSIQLIRTVEDLRLRSRRWHLISPAFGDNAQRSFEEHGYIVAAATSGDDDVAVERLVRHLQRVYLAFNAADESQIARWGSEVAKSTKRIGRVWPYNKSEDKERET